MFSLLSSYRTCLPIPYLFLQITLINIYLYLHQSPLMLLNLLPQQPQPHPLLPTLLRHLARHHSFPITRHEPNLIDSSRNFMRQKRRPGFQPFNPRSHPPRAGESCPQLLLLAFPFAVVEIGARSDAAVPEATEDAVAELDFGGGPGGPGDFAVGGGDFGGVQGFMCRGVAGILVGRQEEVLFDSADEHFCA